MENKYYTDYLDSLTPHKRTIAMEAVEAYLKGESQKAEKIASSFDVWQATRFLANKEEEHIVAIYLNNKGGIKEVKEVAAGGFSCCACDIKVILRGALLCSATAVILVHNHTSSNPQPSNDDDELTRNFKKACEAIKLRALDHVIVTSNNYYSYQDNGKF